MDYTDTINYAAKNGDLEVIKFFHENNKKGFTANAMNYAVKNGHVEVVKFLHQNRKEECWPKFTKERVEIVSRYTSVDVVKYLHENNLLGEFSIDHGITEAANAGRLDIVKYLYEYIPKYSTSSVLLSAIKNNNFEVFDFLYENKSVPNENLKLTMLECIERVENVQKYLDKNSVEYNKSSEFISKYKPIYIEEV